MLLRAQWDTGENLAGMDWKYGLGSPAETKAGSDHQAGEMLNRLAGEDIVAVIDGAIAARAENVGKDNAAAGEGDDAAAVCR